MNRVNGWFVRRDIDGFFGLFVDNLLQLMLLWIGIIITAQAFREVGQGSMMWRRNSATISTSTASSPSARDS